jgi:hypothetical protein
MRRGHLALVSFHRQDASGTQGRDGLDTIEHLAWRIETLSFKNLPYNLPRLDPEH